VIFSTAVGDSTAHVYQAYAAANLDPKVMPIASLTTTETKVRAMGFDVGERRVRLHKPLDDFELGAVGKQEYDLTCHNSSVTGLPFIGDPHA
jgi:Periplasmic binding protein domain